MSESGARVRSRVAGVKSPIWKRREYDAAAVEADEAVDFYLGTACKSREKSFIARSLCFCVTDAMLSNV